MTAVAIVIPACNAGRTLAETIRSALDQPGVAEIVVVDDGSSDDTLAVARSFSPPVRVLTGPNRGASAARNRGIADTRAEWLLFLDADDALTPGSVAARLDIARSSGADVVICDWETTIDDGSGRVRPGAQRSVDWAALGRDAERATATDVWATTAAILYRRDLVERIGGFRADLPVIQDARFLFDAAFHGARFAHAPHVGARYREIPGSLSRRDPARFWQDVLINGRQIETLWRARVPLSEDRRAALHGIYDNAARGLFAAAHPDYFAAVAAQRGLGLRRSRHSRIATPLARLVGLKTARSVLSLVGAA